MGKNKDKRIIPIITDGTFFIQSLKEELITRGVLVKNDIYDYAKDCSHILVDEHMVLTNRENFSDILTKYPELLLTVAYQDGLIHAYQRCVANKTNGSFLRHGYVNDVARHYNTFYKKRLRERNYNLAYYDLGYSDGMISLGLLSEEKAEAYCPPPYIYKDEYFDDLKELLEYLDKNRNNEIFEYCQKKVSGFPEGIIPHNCPWFC